MKHPRTRKQGRRSTDSALAEIREDERAHISRELHDDLGQLLATLRVDLTLLKQEPPGSAKAHQLLENMDTLLQDAVVSLRRIAGNLRPRTLDEGGLHMALEALRQEFEKRHAISCVLEAAPDALLLDERYSTTIYRLVQESLTNIVRHAKASKANVRFARHDGALHISVRDNGRGIRPSDLDKRDAYGLMGMRERIQLLRGTIHVYGDENGTQLEIQLPLSKNSGTA